jgi:hypothetical protein
LTPTGVKYHWPTAPATVKICGSARAGDETQHKLGVVLHSD